MPIPSQTNSAIDARLRRKARAAGFSLHKVRGPRHSNNHGGYMIVELATNSVVAGQHYDMFHGDVERFLSGGKS